MIVDEQETIKSCARAELLGCLFCHNKDVETVSWDNLPTCLVYRHVYSVLRYILQFYYNEWHIIWILDKT